MILTATLEQMAYLFLLIAVGYGLAKWKCVPENTEGILSKLENYIFLPALVMGNFMGNFSLDRLLGAKNLLLGSIAVETVVIPLSILIVRFCSKDKYIRNIYLYGLSFSNFGFMGNAVVSALFPQIFSEYILFTLILWIAIYLWGVPVLLMGDNDEKISLKKRLKNFLNPLLIGMVIGMLVGIFKVPVPGFLNRLVTSLGDCMSPIAMLLTGMTVARSPLKEILRHKGIYAITAVRLLGLPLLFLALIPYLPGDQTFYVCTVCSLAMPLGLNTIVVPGAYGKDTRVASGMALVSHLFSCMTIPLIFTIMMGMQGI